MRQGTQLVVKAPYYMLMSGVRYHFLINDQCRHRVILVHFDAPTSKPYMIIMSRQYFEEGLTQRIILVDDHQDRLPPWLADSELRLAHLRNTREKDEGWVLRTAKARCSVIESAVRDRRAILHCVDPARELNRRARDLKQNEGRYRAWFFSYIAFSMDERALMPPVAKMGKWDRFSEAHENTKYGRPSPDANRQRTYRVDEECKRKILEGYHRFKGLGVSYSSIYSKTLKEIFKCRSTKIGRREVVYQPDCKPIPTYGMFVYHVRKSVGKVNMQAVRYGEPRIRQKSATSKGKFTEQLANLMERMECDGYYTSDLPRGLIENSPQLPLCVVRGVDIRSSLVVAIGLTAGRENADAYRSMLFCMAINKVRFCSYFGITITQDEWPSEGLPPFYISDRGPGAATDLIAEFKDRFPISQLAPSFEGQSKATAESSHPRDTATVGAPTHIQSDLSLFQMARREILQVIRDNKTSDASGRMTPDMIIYAETPTPNEIWGYLDARGRSDAQGIPFDDAVRLFLAPINLKVRPDGLYLYGQRYDSKEFRASGMLDKLIAAQTTSVPGYAIELTVRVIFADLGGQIIELPAVFPALVGESEQDLTLHDQEEIFNQRRRLMTDFLEHKAAVEIDTRSRFEAATEKSWDAGSRKRGRAKNRSSISKQEARDIKRTRAKRKRT